MAGLSFYSHTNCILVVLLVHCCQSGLIGPDQPIIATAGEDITLPCHLVPGENVAEITLEWTRPDLDPRFVFLYRAGQDLINVKNPSYKGRSSLFTDELKHGNISLKLSKVKPADEGRYRCYIPDKDEQAFIDLVVESGAVSSPVISLEGIDRDKTGVVLQCESAGWYPEPELLWLDGEGKLLSAGPTETLRGPDDLYTVSSRVTVEKRHSNNITCRVQQRNTNQSRETHIHVADEFFELTSCSAAPIITGLAVSLAVSIMLNLIGVFFIWRRHKTNVRRRHCLGKNQETTEPEPDPQHAVLMTQEAVSDVKETDTTTRHSQSSKPNTPQRGDIILDEVDSNGRYIRLRNTSTEDQLMTGWALKQQVNNTQPVTFKFGSNFTLRHGETLTLERDGVWSRYQTSPDHQLWPNMIKWKPEDELKISLISTDGECHTLKILKIPHHVDSPQ